MAHPDGVADNMTGSQKDAAECDTGDNGSDQDNACDAELVIEEDLLFVDGTFGCETTRAITVTCTWDSADDGITGTATGVAGTDPATTLFTADDAMAGAKCEVEF